MREKNDPYGFRYENGKHGIGAGYGNNNSGFFYTKGDRPTSSMTNTKVGYRDGSHHFYAEGDRGYRGVGYSNDDVVCTIF